ncbi:MAG: nitroreductase family protein [Thermoleophilia bacterium]
MNDITPIDTSAVSRWTEAAHMRRSRRAYLDDSASGALADALEAHCAGFAPFAGTRVIVLRQAPRDIFTGVVLRMYGKVVSPSALIFVGDRRLPGAAARAGYAGGAAILEATSLGFATCWIGGGVRRDKVTTFLELAAHEHVYSISALGYATDQQTTGERATVGLVGARTRKPMGKLAPGCEAWPTWARTGVELARIAPSATNRQPWRFTFEPTGVRDGNVRLFFESKNTPVISKRLDCGIAMLHFELGVRSAGGTGSWSPLEGNDVARWVGG